MKSLENKSTAITAQAEDGKLVTLDYAGLIKLVCNTPAQGGFSLQDIRTRIAITSASEETKTGKDILLETADATYLQNLVKNMRWQFSHKDILAFSDSVEKMKESTPVSKKVNNNVPVED